MRANTQGSGLGLSEREGFTLWGVQASQGADRCGVVPVRHDSTMDSGAQRAAPRCRGAPHRPPRRRAAAAVDEVKKSKVGKSRGALLPRADRRLTERES